MDGKPYSMDFRERIIARVLAGESIRAIGAVFDINPSVVSKWSGAFGRRGVSRRDRWAGISH